MSKHTAMFLLYGLSIAAGAGEPSERDKRRALDEDRRRTAEMIMAARKRMGDFEPDAAAPIKRSYEPMKVYVTIGGERGIPLPFAKIVEPIRSAQRANSPLQFLEPIDGWSPEETGSIPLALGVKINEWLDVELSRHGYGSFYQVQSVTQVIDPEVAISDKQATAVQNTEFTENTWTLTALPRWKLMKHVAIYGRFGIGYANSNLHSELRTGRIIYGEKTCVFDAALDKEVCHTRDAYRYEGDWGHVIQKGDGFFPIAGVGLELTRYIRVEYQRRFAVPIGNDRRDLTSKRYISVRFFGEWDFPW